HLDTSSLAVDSKFETRCEQVLEHFLKSGIKEESGIKERASRNSSRPQLQTCAFWNERLNDPSARPRPFRSSRNEIIPTINTISQSNQGIERVVVESNSRGIDVRKTTGAESGCRDAASSKTKTCALIGNARPNRDQIESNRSFRLRRSFGGMCY